jgi:hypothetical protein
MAVEGKHEKNCERNGLAKSLDLVAVVSFLHRVDEENEAKGKQHKAADRVVLYQEHVCKTVFLQPDTRVLKKLRLHPRFAHHEEVEARKEVPLDPETLYLDVALFVFAGPHPHHLLERVYHEHQGN